MHHEKVVAQKVNYYVIVYLIILIYLGGDLSHTQGKSDGLSYRIGLSCSPSGTSLEVQWLSFHTSNAGGTGSIPSWGTKFPHATHHGQKLN